EAVDVAPQVAEIAAIALGLGVGKDLEAKPTEGREGSVEVLSPRQRGMHRGHVLLTASLGDELGLTVRILSKRRGNAFDPLGELDPVARAVDDRIIELHLVFVRIGML